MKNRIEWAESAKSAQLAQTKVFNNRAVTTSQPQALKQGVAHQVGSLKPFSLTGCIFYVERYGQLVKPTNI